MLNLDAYAGLLNNVRPLANAYFKGVMRSLRPVPTNRLPSSAPNDLWFRRDTIRVSEAGVRRYFEITDGIDLVGNGHRLLPPVYFTTWFLKPYLDVLSSDVLGLNLLGIVHLENDLVLHRPLTRDDALSCRVGLEALERNERRVLITVRCENFAGGDLASESRSLILARLKHAGPKTGSASNPAPPDPPQRNWSDLRTLRFSEDLGRRYGLLSGDVNPIHLHWLTSRTFGFRRPIAHGFCLKAMVAHGLVRSVGGGDMTRLRRLNIRFKSAIWLPGQATLQADDDGFRVIDPNGERLYAEGEYEMAP
jgi:acyl dehydratase